MHSVCVALALHMKQGPSIRSKLTFVTEGIQCECHEHKATSSMVQLMDQKKLGSAAEQPSLKKQQALYWRQNGFGNDAKHVCAMCEQLQRVRHAPTDVLHVCIYIHMYRYMNDWTESGIARPICEQSIITNPLAKHKCCNARPS